MKLEFGGGTKPKAGFINVDRIATADVVCDLNAPGLRLPYEDETADEVFSSHCLEHIEEPIRVLHEIARVCRIGARVEIHVPHWLHPMALCPGHRCTISYQQVRGWTDDFAAQDWAGCPRRLAFREWGQARGPLFDEAKEAFPMLSDHQLMLFVPGAAHECHFVFEVVRNEP